MTTTATLIARCRTDLGLIEPLLAWAHTDAYNPTNAPTERPITAPRGSDSGPSDEEPKPLPAPTPGPDAWLRCPRCGGRDVTVVEAGRLITTDDPNLLRQIHHTLRSTCRRDTCGHQWTSRDRRDVIPSRDPLDIGSSTSRLAYETAVVHLAGAELSIGTAWTLTTSRYARLVKPLASDPPARPLRAIQGTRTRLDDLVTSSQPYAVRILVGRAADNLDHAWRALNGAFTIGAADPTTQATAKRDLCRICKIRDRENGCGGRCFTCKTYRTRRGHERPTELDSVHDAVEAQERRIARGEGFGEA